MTEKLAIVSGARGSTSASFTLGNRLARLAWMVVSTVFFRPSPRFAHSWRRALLRVFGAKLGRHVNVYSGAAIWAPWNLHAEDRVGIADGVIIYNIAPIYIGSDCVISQRAYLCTGSHDFNSPNFQLTAEPIKLGSKVWICAGAFLGPGVTIANGCVVGAMAVVVRSIEIEWSVWAGNPAVFKRHRRHS